MILKRVGSLEKLWSFCNIELFGLNFLQLVLLFIVPFQNEMDCQGSFIWIKILSWQIKNEIITIFLKIVIQNKLPSWKLDVWSSLYHESFLFDFLFDYLIFNLSSTFFFKDGGSGLSLVIKAKWDDVCEILFTPPRENFSRGLFLSCTCTRNK